MNLINIFHFFIICFSGFSCSSQKISSPPAETLISKAQSPKPGAYQIGEYLPLLQNKSIGCVVNHSSMIDRTHLVDTLIHHGVNVQLVFAPEHGFRGAASDGELIADGRDSSSGVRIVSLYGDKKKPTSTDLAGIETVIFDIQDVGCRFYTYISTLHLVMEACSENNIDLIVLDRPNPNGYYVDGPMLDTAYRSFVGMHKIPAVYGMTIGEFAQLLNGERWLTNNMQCNLTVIPCIEYDHTMTYAVPVAPSPNLPNHRATLLYPSLCFFEGTQVSVGRGTDLQFQVLGHPSPQAGSYTFKPEPKPGAINPPQKGIQLYGLDLSATPIDEILSWKQINLSWLIQYHHMLDPQDSFFLAKTAAFDRLAGSDKLRNQLEAGLTEEEITASWQDDLEAFMKIRKKYLLYADFEKG